MKQYVISATYEYYDACKPQVSEVLILNEKDYNIFKKQSEILQIEQLREEGETVVDSISAKDSGDLVGLTTDVQLKADNYGESKTDLDLVLEYVILDKDSEARNAALRLKSIKHELDESIFHYFDAEELSRALSTAKELLSNAQDILSNAALYESDVYNKITKFLKQ